MAIWLGGECNMSGSLDRRECNISGYLAWGEYNMSG